MRARLAATLRRLAQRLDPGVADGRTHALAVSHGLGDIIVEIDGEQIVRAIKARSRRRGLGSAGI